MCYPPNDLLTNNTVENDWKQETCRIEHSLAKKWGGQSERIGGKQWKGHGKGKGGKSTKRRKQEASLEFILSGHSPQLSEGTAHRSHMLVTRQKSYCQQRGGERVKEG